MSERDSTFWTRLTIAAVTPSVLAAGILYLVCDLRSRRAALDLEAFWEFATAEARKEQLASFPHTIAPMWAPVISRVHRERIEMMQTDYMSLRYRRGIAGGFAAGGTMLLLALGTFWVIIEKSRFKQVPEPTSDAIAHR